jgi:signal transduction histidine kinase
VNLHQNIGTVLNIFNFQLKNKVELTFEVDQSLEIFGIDIKLFQLWSNLIKNAIESMEDEPIQGRLSILSEEKSNQIIIHVINNGPQIPTEIQEQIFDKFYTTKSQKNGSGLGLSIVKNVVEEHNAEILLDSSNEVTKFSIIFNK